MKNFLYGISLLPLISLGQLTFEETQLTGLPTNLTEINSEWMDMDGDGDLDVLIHGMAGEDGSNSVYENNGDNSFTLHTELPNWTLVDFAWQDYDLDGDIDFVMSGVNENNIPKVWLFESSSGAFKSRDILVSSTTKTKVQWENINNDVYTDLVLLTISDTDKDETTVSLYSNLGNGHFQSISESSIGLGERNAVDAEIIFSDFDENNLRDFMFLAQSQIRFFDQTDLDVFLRKRDLKLLKAFDGPLTSSRIDDSETEYFFFKEGDEFDEPMIQSEFYDTPYQLLEEGISLNEGSYFWFMEDEVGNGFKDTGYARLTDSNDKVIFEVNANEFFQSQTKTPFCIGAGEHCYTSPLKLEILLDEDPEQISWSVFGSDEVMYSLNEDQSDLAKTDRPFLGEIHVWGDVDQDDQPDALVRQLDGNWNWALNKSETWANSEPFGQEGVFHQLLNSSDQKVSILFTRKNNDLSEWFLIEPSNSQTLLIPSTPTELTATSDVEIVELTWNSSESFATYELKIEKDGVDLILPESSFADGLWGDDTSAQLRLLESGNYSISVRAIGANNIKSNYSNSVEISIDLPENFNLISEINSILQNRDGYSAFIDIDMDGDLDIFQDGSDCIGRCFVEDQLRFFQLLENINGSYVERELINFDFEMSQRFLPTPTSWIDFDLDGDLDLIMGGRNTAGDVRTILYENLNWFFLPREIALPAIEEGSFTWGDYDNDGDEDVFVSGRFFQGETISAIYERIDNTFRAVDQTFTPLLFESATWVDFDSDGYLDLARCGTQASGEPKTEIYRNTNGDLELIDTELRDIHLGSMTWFDADEDGDKDLLLMGNAAFSLDFNLRDENGFIADPIHFSKIYLNDNGSFTETETGIEGYVNNSLAIGDLDNDGDLDLVVKGLVEGNTTNSFVRKMGVYINELGLFSELDLDFFSHELGNISVGDIDGEGSLDILTNGRYLNSTTDYNAKSILFKNNNKKVNNRPNPPINLLVTGTETIGSPIEILWDSGSDTETPSISLTYSYELYENEKLVSSSLALGQSGSIGFNKSKIFNDLPPGHYVFSVYTVDNGLISSEPTSIDFTIQNPLQRIRSIQIESTYGGATIVDFNNDGNIDITGNVINNQEDFSEFTLYSGSDLSFTEEQSIFISPIIFLYRSFWADLNNDGRQDLVTSYSPLSEPEINEVFINSGDELAKKPSWNLDDVLLSYAGDFDNDGDLDLAAIVDFTDLVLYKNVGNGFEEFAILEDEDIVQRSEWFDYDGDDDLDLIVIMGTDGTQEVNLRIYNNDNSNFVLDESVHSIKDDIADLSLADIDSDGDVDLITVSSFPEKIVKIWWNQDGVFVAGETIIENIGTFEFFPMDWGDFNNDGTLDLATSFSTTDQGSATKLYKNEKGILVEIEAEVDNIARGITYWADFDNDLDLDLFSSGFDQFGQYSVNIYENHTESANSYPQHPSNLITEYSEDNQWLYFTWDRGIDNETPSVALSYNIRLWNDQGFQISPAALDDGTLTLIQTGNAGYTPSYKFDGSELPDGAYSWAVQSIDNGHLGSTFTEPQEVLMCFNYLDNDLNLSTSSLASVGSSIRFDFDLPENTKSYTIDLGDGTMAIDDRNHIYSNAGTYTVVMTATSDLGCSFSESIVIDIEENATQPKITNVITPNGDGKNDFLIVTEARLDRENSLEIFNNAGQSLFKTSNYLNDWDATYNGTILPSGQYLAVFINEGVKTSQVFTILR